MCRDCFDFDNAGGDEAIDETFHFVITLIVALLVSQSFFELAQS